MGLIDKYLLGLRHLGVNSTLAKAVRAAIGAGLDLIPGLEGAEHIARLADMSIDQITRIQKIIWETPMRPKSLMKVVSDVEETAIKKKLSLVKDPRTVKDITPETGAVDKSRSLEAAKDMVKGLPDNFVFQLHDGAVGNAVTRRTPTSIRPPSSPIRSRSHRYKG